MLSYVTILCLVVGPSTASPERAVSIEAERPVAQEGSQGRDAKGAASGGEVLGLGFGGRAGHFAEYAFRLGEALEPARISIRYARVLPGHGYLELSVDGRPSGTLRYDSSGGPGDSREDFRWTYLDLPELDAGQHALRLTVAKAPSAKDFPEVEIPAAPVLDLVGRRHDKNSVGHGRNVAVYTGMPSRFFYATHQLGNVFSATDGGTLAWYPDQVIVSLDAGGGERPDVNLDRIVIARSPLPKATIRRSLSGRSEVIEQRQVCVTRNDVVVSRFLLHNPGSEAALCRIEVRGDCRESRNWRGKPGGGKASRKLGDFMVLVDENVFPGVLGGLCMAVGGNRPPKEVTTTAAGTYAMLYEVAVPPAASRELLLACAFDPDFERAQRNLVAVLGDEDAVAANRRDWQEFYRREVPRFRCSDPGFEELYAFRWFLLRFSTCGGGLGYFKYPVVLEGRQAYQTYCCFSAPFMAFDLSWAVDSRLGFGHIASMVHAAYEDGRFPWYTAPNTNRVPIHHRSGTGLSLLPLAAWKHYRVHGSRAEVEEIYEGLKRNVQWWLADRDPDGDGLFVIHHQLETGMDDLMRWPDPRLPYASVDASSYAYANIRALASLGEALGKSEDARRFRSLAAKTAAAVNGRLWDARSTSWRDRHPDTGELSDLLTVTTFYPFFAGIGDSRHLDVFRKHLLDPEEFWLPHPLPALSKSAPQFNPRGFWRGPAWPAATSHVVEAFARSAKRHDRSLLPQAAELLRRAVRNHLRPRADFFERCNPLTGEPLSSFRDYMHSWWIDIFMRHVIGLAPLADGGLVIDPLPLGFERFSVEGVPYRGRLLDIAYRARPGAPDAPFGKRGLTVRVDGRERLSLEGFVPGGDPARLRRLDGP